MQTEKPDEKVAVDSSQLEQHLPLIKAKILKYETKLSREAASSSTDKQKAMKSTIRDLIKETEELEAYLTQKTVRRAKVDDANSTQQKAEDYYYEDPPPNVANAVGVEAEGVKEETLYYEDTEDTEAGMLIDDGFNPNDEEPDANLQVGPYYDGL